MKAPRLSDLVSIRGRFHRSVSLATDWQRGVDLSEYVVTPTIKEIARRIVDELEHPNGARAWSITGPYGSGKSAFGLFLADLLAAEECSHPESDVLRKGRKVLKRPFVPVLVVAERAPLAQSVIRGLADGLRTITPSFSRRLVDAERERGLTGGELSELAVEAAESACEKGYGGLLLIVDELGKFLEYAASDQVHGDVYFLQQLAEAASRSKAPFLLSTILHSAFADYLPVGQEVRRAEWQKVQGRFQDVPFQLPTEQLLALVGRAIERRVPAELGHQWKAVAAEAVASESFVEARRRMPLEELLHQCLPLHPVAALLLWPLFRSKVAQNERSLFAFLTSEEPYGFQEFLKKTEWDKNSAPVYRVADLFDYVANALGLAAFTGEHARKWSLIDHGLSRIPRDAPEVSRAVIKTIGLLSIYGPPVGLRASQEAVKSAVSSSDGVEEAIRHLEERSIIVYRRHLGGYALWEGSDVDLEAAYDEARRHVTDGDLHARLRSSLSLRPVVARAHYIETGTLRLFDVDVVPNDQGALDSLVATRTSADGRLLFVMGSGKWNVGESVRLAKQVTNSLDNDLLLIAVPKSFGGLEESLRDLECWRWVWQNVPELQGDPVARHEVQARLVEARNRFERVAGRVFGLPGHPFEPALSLWVHEGRQKTVKSPIGFQRWLSHLCNKAFNRAPRLNNELLNRQNLSSAAAAARRTLLARMLSHAAIARIGIEGTPPEASMYESLLKAGGFHRTRNHVLGFGRPNDEWKPAWTAIETFLREAKEARRPVTELFALLKARPYGLRDGPIPVLLTAVLASSWDETALYEEGVFVPELRIEVLERLTRRPETFELQSHRLDRHQLQALKALEDLVSGVQGEVPSSGGGLLPVVKSLVLFAARLSPYAKLTRKLGSPEAVAVRDLMLRAGDPRRLLFEELPGAFGISIDGVESAGQFARRLQQSLRVMARAYPDLLDEIETQIRQVFNLKGNAQEARGQLQRRATPLEPYAVEQKLQMFVREAARDHTDRDWREVLGRVINGGLPPSHWKDSEVAAFQVRLQEVSGEFGRLEELVAERRESGVSKVLRIGILDGVHRESRVVISMEQDFEIDVVRLADRIKDALHSKTSADDFSTKTQLAALVKVAQTLLFESPQTEMSADAR